MRFFRLLAFVTISVFLLCTIAPSVVNSGKRPSEGCIKSKITGGGGITKISGQETRCWRGKKEVLIQYQKVTTMGMTQVTHTATYTDLREGGVIYSVDLSTDPPTGTRTENPMIKSLQEEDLEEVGKKMMEMWGGKIIGKGKVLGKECDIWEVSDMGTKTWIWNWIPLKTVTSMGMIITTEATEISKKCDKKTVMKPNIKYVPIKEKTKAIESLGDIMKQFNPK
jgi:hypothetical protein